MKTAWGKLIQENKQEILSRWVEKVLGFYSKKMDFGTPMGEALSLSLGEILDLLEEDSEALTDMLNHVSRILAVQEFPASKAMSLFFVLKTILREVASKGSAKVSLTQADWDACQTRLEEITLHMFDHYMANREKIYQLKVDENKRRMYMALRRAEA
ncbi:MAG: hypothetical protein HGB11_01395 [Chlorobiales bacterium]|nr:hypothetical protein [Chlorobiales bacterium]